MQKQPVKRTKAKINSRKDETSKMMEQPATQVVCHV